MKKVHGKNKHPNQDGDFPWGVDKVSGGGRCRHCLQMHRDLTNFWSAQKGLWDQQVWEPLFYSFKTKFLKNFNWDVSFVKNSRFPAVARPTRGSPYDPCISVIWFKYTNSEERAWTSAQGSSTLRWSLEMPVLSLRQRPVRGAGECLGWGAVGGRRSRVYPALLAAEAWFPPGLCPALRTSLGRCYPGSSCYIHSWQPWMAHVSLPSCPVLSSFLSKKF